MALSEARWEKLSLGQQGRELDEWALAATGFSSDVLLDLYRRDRFSPDDWSKSGVYGLIEELNRELSRNKNRGHKSRPQSTAEEERLRSLAQRQAVEIREAKQDVSQKDREIARITNENVAAKRVIETVKTRTESLEQEVVRLRRENAEYLSEITRLKRDKAKLERQLAELSKRKRRPVGAR